MLLLLVFSSGITLINSFCTSNLDNRVKVCSSCAEVCQTFGNCCEDILEESRKTYSPPPSTFECFQGTRFLFVDYGMEMNIMAGLGMYVINKCPGSNYRDQCESTENQVPVYHVNASYVYRNEFCALCNGIPAEQLRYPWCKLTCKNETSSSPNVTCSEQEKSGCSSRYIFPKEIVLNNLCIQEVQPDDCTSDSRCQTAATRYSQIRVSVDGRILPMVYRNEFCGFRIQEPSC